MAAKATRITAIVENSVHDERLWAEEGLSILIDIDNNYSTRILFDCGRSGTVVFMIAGAAYGLSAD